MPLINTLSWQEEWRHCRQKFIAYLQQLLKGGVFLLAGFTTVTMGSSGSDVLMDAGLAQDYIYAREGDDVLIYTPMMNQQKSDFYDGGKGRDVLWLRMNRTEHQDARFQADLVRFFYFVRMQANAEQGSDEGEVFRFYAFNLQVRNVEFIIVERLDEGKKHLHQVSKKPRRFQQLKDSSFGTRG